jgi:hypothetical protein
VIAVAGWLALLPLRIAVRLGVRRTVVLVCLLVLGITAYGVAGELGLLDPPAEARTRSGRQAPPSHTATTDIPTAYLTLYQHAPAHCPGLSWTVLAGIGKVESDHGRARLPGVRTGWNHAGAAGPMQFGIGKGRAGNAWARFGRDYDDNGHTSVYDPGDAIPAAAHYLCDAGGPRRLDAALYAYNSSLAYVTRVKAIARHYTAQEGGRR